MNKIFRVVWNQATQSWVAVSELTKAHKKQSSSNSQGSAVKFSGNFIKSSAIALSLLSGHSAYAALNQAGTGSDNAVALGEAANANQARAIAIGKGATISSGQDTIAIGTDTKAKGHTSIVIGKNAKTTNDAEGTVVIGRDAFSEGSGNGGRPNTVVGRGAYTAFGENGTYRLNAATALGFQAGAGLRTDPSNGNKLVSNETNADNNAEVLVKAGYGLDENAPADTKTALQGGNVNNNLTFYRKKHINEATAIGAEARAIGDQSIAIGGQVVAGDGVVALGGNDTDQLRNNKYQVVTADAVNKTNVGTIDDYNLAYTESTNTVAEQYKKLVGRGMPTAYKSTYGQSGSVVIGMEAHSTTALGTAIGTNSVVRMGAFGATAIGAGSTVQTNADAAVAIGMGSVANGAYSLAAGTASWAEFGDIALGYQAKATGKDGAIAMGRATNAQGDSSIMIGGANIASAAAQNTSYEKSNGQTITKSVTEKINGKDVTREYSFAGTTKTNGSVADAYKELTGITMDTTALDFAKNKNGHASTSLGVHALSKGDLGTAIGAGSRSDAIGSVALGVGAHATKQNAVAIGTGSTTDLVGTRQLSVNYDSDGNIVSDNSKDIAYTFKWAGGTNTAEGDVVSFGSSGAERQLKNVAAGRVAEDSTDAINGSQLNSITKKIAAGFNTSGNEVAGSSGVFTSKKANADSAKKDYETAIRSDDKVQLQVGNNLKLDRDETVSEVDVPDDFDKTKTVKKKIRKADFAYSLNPVLTNLTSAEFKGTDAEPTTKLTNAGVTITPVTAGKSPVSLAENGLNNGGNPITNVAGNLDGAKANTTAPTTKADKPSNVDGIKNNAATVGDVLNAGWNLQEKGTAKDFVTAYDTVNFVDGDGTTVSVENTDGKTSKIKYSANLGDGLKKDDATNKITVNAADKSLTVGTDGVKVNTGNINTAAVPTVDAGDENKIATVGNVVDAIKAAAWKATSAATTNGENSGKKEQEVKAGDTVTFEADKNIKIAQDNGKFTFSTKDDVQFTTVKVGDTANGKKPVELKNGDVITANSNPEQPTTALNVSSDGKPTQITGVGSVLNTEAVPTIPAGTATTGNGQPKLVNLGTANGQTPLSPNVLNSAATVRDLASMGWVVSSDKTTDTTTGEYKDVVKNANEVKFIGKNAAKVSGKTDPTTGIRTITVDVEVPSVETAKITQNTDGSVTGPAGETLTKALKDAKDELAKLPKDADAATVKAAQDKVDAAQKAIDNSPNSNKVATAQNVADMINNSGFTLKTSKVEGGEKDATSTGDEVINPGKAVEMIAGKNLTVKQEANGKVTYSTKDNVEFTSVKVGEDKDGKKPVNFTTEAAKPANNNGTDKTPTTALNVSSSDGKPTQITGVGSTLNVKPVDTNTNGTPTADADKPNLVDLVGPKDAPVNKNAAATVGDLQNMGWVVSTKDGNGYNDVVKNANQVDFVGKNGITVTGETGTDGVRTITVEAAQTPVVYTNKAGDKLVKVGDKFYKANEVVDGKPTGTEVPKEDVIASMNNGDNNTANNPMHLANIGSNLPTVNDTNKQAFDPNSTTPKADKNNKSAPMTAAEAADLLDPNSNKFAGNNAATVSDVLNAGWNLQGNGSAVDFVKPFDTVNFVNGKGTKAVVETADNLTSTVKFDVDAGEITSNTNGSVTGPVTADEAKKLAEDLKNAEQAVKDLPENAPEDKKAEAQKALKDAQAAAAPLNKVATAQNVADMINASGFTLKTSNVDGGEKVSGDDEIINPGKAVEMIAGKNLTVKQEANGKVTYATKDDVEFNTVKVGDAKDGKAPVNMKTEAAKPATNNGADQPTTALNFTSGEGDKAKPTQLTGVGSTLNVKPVDTNPNGTPTEEAARPNLVDLVGTTEAPVNKNAAATVGDLQNMGWVVSTKDGNGYTDVVKNANQVDFKGDGLATVTGETKGDIRTITVNVDAQKTVEAAQTPVVYTNKDGDKLVKVGDKFYKAGDVVNGKPKDGAPEVPKGDVIASMNNGDNNTSKPMQLANIGSNLPTVNDTTKQAFDPNSTEPKAGKDNKSAPITADEAANIAKKAGNNAATVSDVLNAGWNLQGNGQAVDFVKPFDTVNFVNGKGTKAVVETNDNLTSTVKFDVDAGEITSNTNGSVNGPTTAENAKKLADDLKKAEQAVKDLPADATEDKKAEAQKALKDAQDAAAPLNKVATAQNVADMINASGFTLKTSKVEGGEKDATSTGDEVINPGKAVEMIAGKNLTVKQEANGKVTYATKDDVEFNTVKVGGDANTYVDDKGNPVTKQGDSFVDAKGNKVDAAKVSPVAPVTLKTEKASPANNNAEGNHPTTALNIAAGNKPTQLKGVGSVLNTADVNTSTGDQRDTDGNIKPAQPGTDKLVDLGTNPKKGDKPLSEETLNSAATVRDLANMGWVVSAKDNNYTNTVKNANKVEFKGDKGISVTGKDVTQKDGTVTREITVAIADGKVTDKVTITKDGKDIPAIKIGDNYYEVDKNGKPVGYEVDEKGKPTANNKPIDVDGATITNEGNKVVTGNTVATAIQESGWNVGLANTADADKAFNDADKALSATKLEKVNPNDNVRFADGKGTKAAVATVEHVDEFGKKVTDTYVKFDVDAGKVEATKDAAGNNTGAVTGPVTAALNDALMKAQDAQKALKPDATQAEKDAAQAAVDAANLAITNAGNQVATAQNVAEAINNSGWRTNSTTATGGAKDTLINPGKAVNFESGKNMEVAQTVDKDGNVAYTYKTKDDVQFNSVQFGGDTGPKITNNGGNINVSGPDGKAPTKITGVAAGDISPESSDAVNGAQIYALSRGNVPNVKNITVDGKEYKNVIVDENGTPILKTYNVKGQKEIITNSVVEAIYNMNEQGIKFFHSNDGVERLKVEDKNSFDSSASGKFATAIGSKSSAEGTNSVAIGFNSVVTGNDSISIGTGNRVTGNNSGAFGDPSTVSGQRSYSVGNNNTVATNDTFVLGNEVTQTVENSVILGKKSTATAGDGSATGTLNNIKQDGTKGTSTTAGSKGTVKQAIVGNMVYGGFEGATADGVVSVGAAGNERRVQNVAAGEISATSTDAINGSQLYSVAQGVGNRLGDLNNKINRNNKNLRAGIAGANAAAGLPQVYIPGKSMVAASAGTYKGQSALAVGYSRASDNGKLILKLQGNANTRGDVGGSVGVGYQW